MDPLRLLRLLLLSELGILRGLMHLSVVKSLPDRINSETIVSHQEEMYQIGIIRDRLECSTYVGTVESLLLIAL